MNDDNLKVLFSEKELDDTVSSLARKISMDYQNKNLLLVGLLKGSVVFMTDLMRKITVPCEIDFMAVSSYGNKTQSSGEIKIDMDLLTDISEYDVLLIEDIVDSGNTLSSVIGLLSARNPKSLKLCTMFDKPDRREREVNVDYVGRVVPNEFVVGYGMDYAEKYRNLPCLCVLKSDAYTKEDV